jgi:hypothetical protein
MEIHEALEQLDEIHHHVHRSQVYKGYRSVLTAIVGLSALFAAFLQPQFVDLSHPLTFIRFWVTVAAINSSLPIGSILFHFVLHENRLERHKTRQAIGQFIPCLVAGAVLTYAVCRSGDAFIPFLPGIWCILFGMGVYASRPYLPSAIDWMAAIFFLGGIVLLGTIPSGQSLSPWGMGSVFGFGLLIGAVILYLNIERNQRETEK